MQLPQRACATIIANLDRIDEARQQILDLLLPDDAGDDAGCPHPADRVEDLSTLGTEQYHCRACGDQFDHDPRASVDLTQEA